MAPPSPCRRPRPSPWARSTGPPAGTARPWRRIEPEPVTSHHWPRRRTTGERPRRSECARGQPWRAGHDPPRGRRRLPRYRCRLRTVRTARLVLHPQPERRRLSRRDKSVRRGLEGTYSVQGRAPHRGPHVLPLCPGVGVDTTALRSAARAGHPAQHRGPARPGPARDARTGSGRSRCEPDGT